MSKLIFETKQETLQSLLKYCAGKLQEESSKVYKLLAQKEQMLGIKLDDQELHMLDPRVQEEWINVLAVMFCAGYREGLADGYLDGKKD